MAALAKLYIKKDVLETLLSTISEKEAKGVEFTISINDETNEFGQNLSAFVSQTKEQQEQQKKKYYVGNGKVVWVKGDVKIAEKKEQQSAQSSEPNDLPF